MVPVEIEKIVYKEVPVPVDRVVYNEVPVPVEVRVQHIVDRVEIKEVPTDRIVQQEVPVMVDKIIVRDVPYPVERFVEKQVIKEIEKCITQEVPVYGASSPPLSPPPFPPTPSPARAQPENCRRKSKVHIIRAILQSCCQDVMHDILTSSQLLSTVHV